MVKYSKLRNNRISKISRKNKIVTKKYNKITSIKQVNQTNKITKKQSGGDAGGMGGHAGDVIAGCEIVEQNRGEVVICKKEEGKKDVYFEDFWTVDENKLDTVVKSLSDKLTEIFKVGTKVILKVVELDRVDDKKEPITRMLIEDREFIFREWIEKSEKNNGDYKPYYELMSKNIPGILVLIPGKNKKEQGTYRVYMIQESVVQADAGFVFDFKIGAQTAFKCDIDKRFGKTLKRRTHKFLNTDYSKSKEQGWRMESLRSINDAATLGLYNHIAQKIKNKDTCPPPKTRIPKWILKSLKKDKHDWYNCNAEFLIQSLKYLLSPNSNYVLNIKLGDFGHPFMLTTTNHKTQITKDFSTRAASCDLYKVQSIINNFNDGLNRFKDDISQINVDNTRQKIDHFGELVKQIIVHKDNNLGFVGSSIMLGVYEKKPTKPEVEEPSAPVEESPAESHYEEAPSYKDRYGIPSALAPVPVPVPVPEPEPEPAPEPELVSAQRNKFKDLVLNPEQINQIEELIEELKTIQ